MGYMGFGMQKWIYNMKPRKPFRKTNKSGYETVSGTDSGDFNLYNLPSEKTENLDERIRMDKKRMAKNRLRSKIVSTILSIVVLSSLAWIFIVLLGQYGLWSGQNTMKKTKESAELEHQFIISMKMGHYYIEKDDFEMAITEYKNAVRLKKDNFEAHEALAGAYYTSCFKYNRHCMDAITEFNYLVNIGKPGNYFKARAMVIQHVAALKAGK